MMTEYDKLKKSLRHLEQQYANYLSMNEREYLSDLDNDAIELYKMMTKEP